jgi:dipeptidyl aminopeptidase/acylaminoacyl peptidase
MKFCGQVFLALSLLFQAGFSTAQSRDPDSREITYPIAITSPPNTAARPIPIDDLFYTRSVSSASWSPDSREIVFTTDISGRSNLWKVNAGGGWPIQLSQSDERQYGETWSPDGKWIVYQQDTAGNELWDLYAISSVGGEAVNLTNTPGAREEAPLWSRNGKTIALRHKLKDSTVYNIALMDWASHKVTLLTHEETPDHIWSVTAWSPDGKTLYGNRTETSFTDADVYAIDVASGKTTNLTEHQGKALNQASSLSKDGKTLLISSNQQGGYQNVALLDIETRKLEWITHTKWEATAADFSPDGKSVTYTINADGHVDIYMAHVGIPNWQRYGSSKLKVPPGLNNPAAYPSSFAPTGDWLLFSHESAAEPADLWIYERGGNVRQLTVSAIASLNSTPRVPAQIVSYKAFDGKTISALLWMPFNLKRDGSNPALVLPHGGPTGQTVDYWNPRVAALVSRGYICIAPNVRGSTGYGMDFQKANYKDLGGGDLQDEVYAAKFLEATGYVNPKRIGITGGSYGGYMTLMAVGRTPDVWAAGVEQYGIINWISMLDHEDAMLREYEKSLLGDPVKDRAVYDAASPITYLHNAKAPLLVLQGDNDPRVPKEEAEQVVELLKKDGKIVDAHYYANEGHGFEKRENQIDSIRRTIEWFDKYLKGN